MKTTLLLFSFLLSCLAYSQEYSRAKIFADSKGLQTLAELGIAIDHGTIKRETFFISDFSKDEIKQMREVGFEVEILIADVQTYYVNRNLNNSGTTSNTEKNTTCPPSSSSSTFTPTVPSNFNLGTMGGFYTYQEFLAEIDAMATQYPNLITVKDTISNFLSIQNRPIYWMRLSDNPNSDEAEPEVLYTAVHHAREPNSLSEVIFYMWYLLENYNSSQEVKFLVDNTEMYFVPMINPDGYIHNQTTNPNGGGMWRKNRRLNSGGSYGVDLNRNYSYGWGTTGTSTQQNNDTYCGTAAFSEPETQAIKWFCENRDFQYAFNAHTYANDILFPIGTTTAEFAVDHNYFEAFTHHMVQYNGYENKKSSALYPASGDSDDYMYKSDTIVKPKIFAMTPEVSNTSDGFWPASNEITGICQDMVFPNLILSHLTHRYLEVNDIDPSMVSTTTGNFNHSAYRLGLEDGPVNVSITPITGIQSVGTASTHNLAIMGSQNSGISYVLNPTIQFGDIIKYVLNTEYIGWTKHDTIVKTFGNINSQFIDEANSAANWTGNWATTTSIFVSPSTSFTDSPSGDYANNTTRTYLFNNTIDLTHVTAAQINFYAKWEIEADFDYCQFQVSTDNGTTWIGQCGNYTVPGNSADGSVQPNGQPVYEGTESNWVREEINLSDYIGDSIRVRFILKSDGGTRGDGFYFDDFEILYNIDATGLSENEIQLFHLVPNPASSHVSIVFDQKIQGGKIELVNLSGETISQYPINPSSQSLNLSTENLSEGVYYVRYIGLTEQKCPVKLVVIH
ncbi:M14 family zinc carboxypeptidase [Fluviicola taffensis]|uniref:carboxypeptidase T n=1 Tax=Fluviicola taffensis (strain DSM 16823 / NCIMB 13979 / RW262) TaxID=755732 RepID=F2IBW7_FLUTR|nr:M14 family zinc carboxypeptidase [Fluviicola taffensis]AEA42195.1 Carboxypeptidase T [Fluviicola taffensis DSM 16823]